MNDGKYCLDSNIFITAWSYSHPRDVFPTLWEKLIENKESIVLIKPIFEEIDPIDTETKKKLKADKLKEVSHLRLWLDKYQFFPTPIDDAAVEEEALQLEREYKTRNLSKGAGSNDIRLIAYAKLKKQIVATFEEKQKQAPQKKFKYKIPLICEKERVECIDFIDLLRRLDISI